jgi:pilus assembly protein CpaB
MKSKTMILMVVAVVCGLAASYMTSRLLADRNEKVKIVVAKKKLNAWYPIKNPEEAFELEERTKNDVPRNAVTKLETIKDFVLIKGIEKGETLVSENVMDRGKGGLDVILPPGKRAVAVRTSADTVAGGHVLPGSRVDILHTVKRGDKEPECRVILQNILVRAVDLAMSKPEERQGVVPATVTLEVTPSEATELTKVKDVGSITLALRAMGDDKVENVAPPPPPVEKETKVAEGKPGTKEETKPVVQDQIERKTMLILNGTNWTRATFITKNGEPAEYSVERNQGDSFTPPPAPTPSPEFKAPPPAANGPKERGGTPPPAPQQK